MAEQLLATLPRKVPPANPACSGLVQKLCGSCRTDALGVEGQRVGRIRLSSARFGAIFCRFRPTLGQHRPSFGQHWRSWSNLARFGRSLPDVCRCWRPILRLGTQFAKTRFVLIVLERPLQIWISGHGEVLRPRSLESGIARSCSSRHAGVTDCRPNPRLEARLCKGDLEAVVMTIAPLPSLVSSLVF